MNTNDIYFNNIVKTYPNLQDLKVENNHLLFQNHSLPLGKFNLASLFYNYGDLHNDLAFLTASDLFSLIYIHVMYYQDSEKLLHNFKIVSKKPKEEALIKYYQDYLYYLLRYRDYLTNDLKEVLNNIEQQVIKIEYRGYFTYEEIDFNKKFYELNNLAEEDRKVWQEKKQKSKELSRKRNTETFTGFANAFIILLTTLFFAIIISVTILIFCY